jgi:hypothetical protein
LRGQIVAGTKTPMMANPDDPEWDDNPEWTAEDFARARPASEVHGAEFAAAMIALKADPNDPEDFDVTQEALEKALAERRARRAALADMVRHKRP